MNPVNQILKVALHTSLISSSRPVSVLLVGPSGGGKSATISRFSSKWIHHASDVTTRGLYDLAAEDTGNQLRAICIPDLNVPLSHKPSVSNLTIATILSLSWDGTARIDDGRQNKILRHNAIGFYSGCTPDMFLHSYRRWQALGLMRRFITLHYNYGVSTRCVGSQMIREGKIDSSPLSPIPITTRVGAKKGILISIPTELTFEIEKLGAELAIHLSYRLSWSTKTHRAQWTVFSRELEFAPHVLMQTMARASALTQGRRSVNEDDIAFLCTLLRFTNPSHPGEL